jgi:hypothetical protein
VVGVLDQQDVVVAQDRALVAGNALHGGSS